MVHCGGYGKIRVAWWRTVCKSMGNRTPMKIRRSAVGDNLKNCDVDGGDKRTVHRLYCNTYYLLQTITETHTHTRTHVLTIHIHKNTHTYTHSLSSFDGNSSFTYDYTTVVRLNVINKYYFYY